MKILNSLKNHSSFLESLHVFLATRIPLFSLAVLFMGFADITMNITIFQAFSQWDGQWYMKVAREGYNYLGPNIQTDVAFPPLYPVVSKLVNYAAGSLELSFALVSSVSFFVFLFFFHKITGKYFNQSITYRSIWYISIFPLSFVFSVFYSESLFFMFIAGSFYFAYKKKWYLSIVFAILASLTRFSGLVMLPTLLYYYFKSNKKYKISQILGFLTIPGGIFLFSVYLKYKVGDFFAYIHVLKAWKFIYQNPFITIASALGFMHSLSKFNYFTALGSLDLIMLTFFTILLILSFKRLPRELFVYSLLIFLLYIFKSWDPGFFYPLGSNNRELLEAFPLFIIAAKLGENKLYDMIYTVVSLIFLGILSLSFYSGKWVF